MLINKEKLINKIATEVHYDTEHPLESYAKLLMMIVEAEEEAEEEEDVSHAEWIIHYNHNTPFMAHCSECGFIDTINSINDLTEYCSFCGSRMDKGEET